MSWTRVDDGFMRHPKIAALMDRPVLYAKAVTLWLGGNCYANEHATDGAIPRGLVRALAPFPDALKIAEVLVERGLWERTADGYLIHDFTKYNPTRADRRAGQDRANERRDKSTRRIADRITDRIGDPIRDLGSNGSGILAGARSPAPAPVDQDQKLPSPTAPALVEDRPSEAEKPRKPAAGKKKDRPVDPRHGPFKAHFMAQWLAVKRADFYWTPRDAKDAVRVLALGDNAEIRRRLEIALADPFFLKTGRVGQLADGWNGYAAPPPMRATGPPEGPRYLRMVRDPTTGDMIPEEPNARSTPQP